MHSNKNSPCNFRINLQSHNFNKSTQYYQIIKSTYLKHTHELSALKCAHLSIDNETKQIIKNMSKVNIDSIKISGFLYQQKALRITTKQVSYLINQDKGKQNEAETEQLISKMESENCF